MSECDLKVCSNCDWRGLEAKMVVCDDCREPYFVCPNCGSVVISYHERPFLMKIRA